ncbi:gamma-glutamylcyclotransferase [Nordella sp. HKS 07]|uniref:gamma-glutamylcyclotransferase n=1 Tax=Nordella sp. HKS 07 TaxID=2712222 RepID=UPI0013E16CDB|nr:gamma-glutamylcyclotransferase [Nordella sp. HKS 07]QIG48415.1 gamma-glutamylcyclotransferase [Nordella sp. HKS 07]
MKTMSLTPEHIARIHRAVPDGGVPHGMELHSDADYAHWVDLILRTRPEPAAPVRLFAFGSLIWKPEFDHIGEMPAVARGRHRAFCLRLLRSRGTPEAPGLMMALDRGGRCSGILYDLPSVDIEGQLHRLFRREFTHKPINNTPRWITVDTAAGPVPALTFVMNRASPFYAGRLPLETVADVLAHACGHWGTGAEYLLNTVSHLEAKGIHDRNLWRLQRLVAMRIEKMGI